MPNWCENDLLVSGPPEYLKTFLDHVEGPHPPGDRRDWDSDDWRFDFNKLIPYPDSFLAMDKVAMEYKGDWENRPKDGFNSGGYEWCIQHWGTKWNAHSVRIDHNEVWPDKDTQAVTIHFDTAWSPPTPVIEAASILFPMLDFDLRYFECGCAFNGIFRAKGGEILTDETGQYFGNRGG